MTAKLTWTARIVRCTVHDGDTLTNVHLDVGWGVTLSRSGTAPLSVRITSSAGPINAPEVTGPEKAAGLAVGVWLSKMLANVLAGRSDAWLISHSLSREAYGRCIGEVRVNGRDLGSRMRDLGFVKDCEPSGKRVPFTDAELSNILAHVGAKP